MVLTLEEVKSALACPVEVAGGAVAPHRFKRDGEGMLRVCGHGVVSVKAGAGNLSKVTCKRCGHSWRMFHPPTSLERREYRLAGVVREARQRG